MPRLLELALECEEYRALPYSGGVMEQPAGLMRKLRQVGNVYRAIKTYERDGNKPGEAAKWKGEHEDIWEIVNQVNELRAKYG
jgi:hypothetical protein